MEENVMNFQDALGTISESVDAHEDEQKKKVQEAREARRKRRLKMREGKVPDEDKDSEQTRIDKLTEGDEPVEGTEETEDVPTEEKPAEDATEEATEVPAEGTEEAPVETAESKQVEPKLIETVSRLLEFKDVKEKNKSGLMVEMKDGSIFEMEVMQTAPGATSETDVVGMVRNAFYSAGDAMGGDEEEPMDDEMMDYEEGADVETVEDDMDKNKFSKDNYEAKKKSKAAKQKGDMYGKPKTMGGPGTKSGMKSIK